MKIGFTKKFGILFGVLFFVMFTFLNSSSYAATVGQKLSEPEAEWERYDDGDKNIKYLGSWANDYFSEEYNSTSKYTSQSGAQIKFSFYGTKLRLIGTRSPDRPNNVQITIDDNINEVFSQNGPLLRQNLSFEKTGLPEGRHNVTITVPQISAGYYDLDAVDIDKNGKLLDVNTATNLKVTAGDSQVTLKWDRIENAESYTIKYGTESGKYTETVTATKDVYGNFVIPGLTNGTKYYFVVSAKVNGVDSEYSNEASATPLGGGSQPDPEPTTGDRAILVVTMTTGLEKEFDLSMKEVNDFISWYEGKQAGSGSASYAINKHDNNKGPFSSRKDYMLFDRILTFEVSEYSK
ncbi:fibronectin type III domain-containing protein [Paenibacillus sp. TY11]|uniref:fibronectin type III domain-containing protein n=1 Tax=Paenibacillus sp. TY11 TaxID=3448633 RepID=UPI00403A54E5